MALTFSSPVHVLPVQSAVLSFRWLRHNLAIPAGYYAAVRFFRNVDETAALVLVPPGADLRISVLCLVPGVAYKAVATMVGAGGVQAGAWWIDEFIYSEGLAEVEFISQGGGGGGAAKSLAGNLTLAGAPVGRAVYALGIDGGARLLASAVSDSASGDYLLAWQGYTGRVLVLAADDYGQPFQPLYAMGVGDRIHPDTPNGFVYEVTGAGETGAEAPAWPLDEGVQVISGSLQLVAVPYYRPKAAGPFEVL